MFVELPYSLRKRYKSIAIAWTVILVPPIFLNLGLFYGLWYGTAISRIAVLTIPTGILGIFTALAIIERIWKLTQTSPRYRPVKSPRFALDIFQWGYFGALILISALISTTLARGDADDDQHELQVRLVSLPVALLLFYLACLTFLTLVLGGLGVKLPFRFGSSEPGTIVRPAIYYIVEDVVAVDGNGGLEFRLAWTARYTGSPVFQGMIWWVSVVWSVTFFVMALLFAYLVFVLPWPAVYAVGWAGPFPLAGLLGLWTLFYVRKALNRELIYEALSDEGTDAGRDAGEEVTEDTPLLNS